MFVRKKKNRSGSISIVIVDKSSGKYKEITKIGIARSEEEVFQLIKDGELWIERHIHGEDMFEQHKQLHTEQVFTEALINNIQNILLNGLQLIIDPVYDQIGFNQIPDRTLRQLVISRLGHPLSKSASVEYLKSHFNEDVNLNKIYRYMDKLYNGQQEEIQRISVEHTKKILGGKIGLLFYDVTTLYFETDQGDNFQ